MATADVTTQPELAPVVSKYATARDQVNSVLVERRDEVDLLFQCLIAKVHPLFIGGAGVAKSMLVDQLIAHISGDVEKFTRLLMKNTPPEEVLGPPNLLALKEGKWERVIDHKLPTAHVAFLDEIFKANSTVLNALLKIINERKFENNGGTIDVPLWMLVGASNELPGHDRDDLRAFRDRFGICKIVKPVRTEDGRLEVLDGQLSRLASGSIEPEEFVTVSMAEIVMLQQAVGGIEVPKQVRESIVSLQRQAEAENLHVSSRRIFEGVRVAMAKAMLRGESRVSNEDLTIMQHVLWTDPDDAGAAYDLTLEFAGEGARKAAKFRSEYEPIMAEINELKPQIPSDGNFTDELAAKFARVNANLKAVGKRVTKAIEDTTADGHETTDLQEIADQIREARQYVRDDVLGMGLD